jgi:hypothetical protein
MQGEAVRLLPSRRRGAKEGSDTGLFLLRFSLNREYAPFIKLLIIAREQTYDKETAIAHYALDDSDQLMIAAQR